MTLDNRFIRVGLSGFALVLALATSGCGGNDPNASGTGQEAKGSDPSAPSVEDGVQAAYPGTEKGATDLMARLGAKGDLPLLTSLKPTAEDYQTFFEAGFAERAQGQYEEMWSEMLAAAEPLGKPDQTEVRLLAATTDDIRKWTPEVQKNFPGGYEQVKDQLKPGFTVYVVKFVRPGEDLGMRYDGLTHVNGHWALFPKPWNVSGS